MALTIAHPNAAGIDVGSASHFVAVPPGRDDELVREFPSFIVDLNALADWLKVCRVDIVAMVSTGVYWIPLFELLESRGFAVLLVNARHVKHVPGRKSDVRAGFDHVFAFERDRKGMAAIPDLNWVQFSTDPDAVATFLHRPIGLTRCVGRYGIAPLSAGAHAGAQPIVTQRDLRW